MLSDYLLLECVSRGGVADVYRARPGGEESYEVAVKVFRPGYAQRASFRDYFLREAEKIGQFDHPNILPFLEYGEGENLLYMVTPFVMTGTLEDLLKRVGGKFSAMQALPIMQQLCSALHYAHDRHVIHGNIKPSNVFVASDGRMLLADFGIAHGYDDSQQSLTRVGWGSAEYAAPEQSLGVVRSGSDIYALGVLLFRILTGVPPFTGQTPVEVLLKHVRQPAPSARALVPSISDAVDGVLRMALQKRSDNRFATAEEFSNAFFAAVTVAPVASPVAKPVTAPLSQSIQDQTIMEAQTPLPAYHAQAIVNDPQTPFPASIALMHSTTVPISSTSQPLSPPVSPLEDVTQRIRPPRAVEPMDEDRTERRKQNFWQEKDEKGVPLFWSVDPAEWSPIAKASAEDGPHAVPLTANAYLESKPLASSSPEMAVASSDAAENEANTNDTALGKLLRKWLPLVVVLLLLLGLLGALLSAFFFPGA